MIILALASLLAAASIAQADSVLVIDGAGDGHGVGMSQTGAAGLALHGYSAREILAHYFRGTTIGHLPADQSVSVLLQSGLQSVVFTGATRAGWRVLGADATYIASAEPDGDIALESGRGRLLAQLAAPLEITSRVPITFDGAASSGVIDGRYRGSLRIVYDAAGRLDLINHVGLESYLRGVVPAESPSNWPAAELEAQAIAARSYAVASTPHAQFDLYADTRSQQYGGYDAEAPSTDAAVAATTGEVVTYADRPIVAYYFASSGGETESVQNAFAGFAPEPYLTAVLDPYDSSRFGPITMSLATAERKLAGIVQGTLESIDVTQRGRSPRVLTADVVGSEGTTRVSGQELANALGLHSTWDCFTVSSDVATLASDWARACAKPDSLTREPAGSRWAAGAAPKVRVGASQPQRTTGTGASTAGGAVASPSVRIGASQPKKTTGSSGSSGSTGSTGSTFGGAVGPPA